MIKDSEFRGLYQQYEKLVRATIFYLARPNELDELVQETFVKIWQKGDSFKERSSLSTWIYRVAYNTAIDALRKKKAVTAPIPSGQDHSTETKDLVEKAMGRMSENEQEILKLFYYVELTHDEIASMLDIPLGTVKSRIHNAKGRLEEVIKEIGGSL